MSWRELIEGRKALARSACSAEPWPRQSANRARVASAHHPRVGVLLYHRETAKRDFPHSPTFNRFANLPLIIDLSIQEVGRSAISMAATCLLACFTARIFFTLRKASLKSGDARRRCKLQPSLLELNSSFAAIQRQAVPAEPARANFE